MIRVKLFGTTAVEVDGHPLPCDALRGRPRQVLEILALADGAPVAKDRLADLVWEGAPPAGHHGTLESYICVLRRCLGLRSGRGSLLATSAGGYQLVTPAVSVDLVEFRALTRAAVTASAADAVAMTSRALTIAQDGLLESEPYASWAERAREIHGREGSAAFVHAAGLANGIQSFDLAASFALAALRHDRLSERAWQHLIRSYWLAGRHAEALRAYAELRAVVLEELGDEPGRESQELYQAVLQAAAGRAEHAEPFTELRTLLKLLRQSLETIPGVLVPARDAALSAAAIHVLAAQR